MKASGFLWENEENDFACHFIQILVVGHGGHKFLLSHRYLLPGHKFKLVNIKSSNRACLQLRRRGGPLSPWLVRAEEVPRGLRPEPNLGPPVERLRVGMVQHDEAELPLLKF